ncbi:hypothetical protein [Methanosarcina sp. UBA411]|jgi:hypothetical protein|uniref:hypothetical protein n=1 Tax=Methanosarcina sp. UBA411 TaxID=1915589 RepID=UPI0025E76E30|nr:hypothetical protein [Methanosarcina sp. UBA411]
MEEVNKKLRYLGIALLILAGFFILLPYVFMGPPTSFFSVENGDETNHIVLIKIVDSNSKPIFEENYKLSPHEKAKESKSLWLLSKMTFPLNKNNYTIKATLENNISTEESMSLNPWTSLHILVVNESIFIDRLQI